MRSISILEQLLAIVRSDSSNVPSMQVTEQDNGLLLTLAPSDISQEERADIWRVFAETLVEELRREVPELRVRVVPPAEGFSGVLQYTWPRRTTSILEERIYWEAIVAALPTVEALTNARLVDLYRSQAVAHKRTVAPPARAANRAPSRRQVR